MDDIKISASYGTKVLDQRQCYGVMTYSESPTIDDTSSAATWPERALITAGFVVNPVAFVMSFAASYLVFRAARRD